MIEDYITPSRLLTFVEVYWVLWQKILPWAGGYRLVPTTEQLEDGCHVTVVSLFPLNLSFFLSLCANPVQASEVRIVRGVRVYKLQSFSGHTPYQQRIFLLRAKYHLLNTSCKRQGAVAKVYSLRWLWPTSCSHNRRRRRIGYGERFKEASPNV